MRGAVRIAIAAPFVLLSISAAAQIPIQSRHYQNPNYGFSVDVPNGFLGCISEVTNHGIDIMLDRRRDCGRIADIRPYVDVYANYNVASGASNSEHLAQLRCREPPVRRVVWLSNVRLGRGKAVGCRRYVGQNGIEVEIIALRHTVPGDPESGIAVSANLFTTSARYKSDVRSFRRILQTIRIAPD